METKEYYFGEPIICPIGVETIGYNITSVKLRINGDDVLEQDITFYAPTLQTEIDLTDFISSHPDYKLDNEIRFKVGGSNWIRIRPHRAIIPTARSIYDGAYFDIPESEITNAPLWYSNSASSSYYRLLNIWTTKGELFAKFNSYLHKYSLPDLIQASIDKQGEAATGFSIMDDDTQEVIRINIIPSPAREERYFIDFVNQYGMRERLEIDKVAFTPKFNSRTCFGTRSWRSDDFTAVISYHTSLYTDFILAMLFAKEQYLVFPDGECRRVVVEAEANYIDRQDTQTAEIRLNIKATSTDIYVGKAPTDSPSQTDRVFSDEFSAEFA